jgi:hypothetical protein
VEGRVEARNVGHVGPGRPQAPDEAERDRLVERIEGDQTVQRVEDTVVDQHRVGEAVAPVHDAVADGVGRAELVGRRSGRRVGVGSSALPPSTSASFRLDEPLTGAALRVRSCVGQPRPQPHLRRVLAVLACTGGPAPGRRPSAADSAARPERRHPVDHVHHGWKRSRSFIITMSNGVVVVPPLHVAALELVVKLGAGR